MKKKNAMGAHDVAGRVTGQHIPTGINKFWVHWLVIFYPTSCSSRYLKKKNDGKIRGVDNMAIYMVIVEIVFTLLKYTNGPKL